MEDGQMQESTRGPSGPDFRSFADRLERAGEGGGKAPSEFGADTDSEEPRVEIEDGQIRTFLGEIDAMLCDGLGIERTFPEYDPEDTDVGKLQLMVRGLKPAVEEHAAQIPHSPKQLAVVTLALYGLSVAHRAGLLTLDGGEGEGAASGTLGGTDVSDAFEGEDGGG